MIYKEFNELIKKIRTVICNILAQSLLMMKHKIVICLFEKYITKSEEQ